MEQKQSIQQFKGQNRLPKFAVPKRYDLTLRPDFLTCSFSGTVLIELSIVDVTKFLVLNVLDLAIEKVWFTDTGKHEFLPTDVVVDHDDEILVILFDKALDGGDGVLGIEFSGILNEHMKGLYKGTYMDGDVKKNMVVTQFEAVDARLCFPCWDEPALKAIFKITVDVPSELTALSNMPVANEKHNGAVKTVTFEESPLMSTYLVALVVGAFDHIEGTTADGRRVGVYCPVGKSDQGKFALDVAMKAMDIYTEYFSVPYPLPKLDMVGVSDFSGGAMENYGLIVYRESELLYDEIQSSAANKQRLVIVVAHEVAHQWFGNLVTMEWWTHLWLNEGFATWISYWVADMLYPEWKIWTQFLKEFTNGLHIDALEQSHPIEVEVHHARSVIEIFDAISYQKGSAIIRMLKDFVGDQSFRKSLGTYMQRYSCKNAKTDDLWSVMTEESGIQVDRMMDTWTKQKGYPVISVRLDGNTLEFEQTQFQLAGIPGNRQWIIPMIISVGSYERCKNFLLETKGGRLDISELFAFAQGDSDLITTENKEKSNENLWIKINAEQTGFYRVKYEDKLASQLMKAIQNNKLSAADRFGILDDTFSFFEAYDLQLSSLLTLMDVYRKETDYVVLSRLIEICTTLDEVASVSLPCIVNELRQYFVNLLLFSAEKLGWQPRPGESHLDSMLREKVLMALATFGHDNTLSEATKRFQAFLVDRNTPLLPAGTRRAAYVAVMRNASAAARSGFESLFNVYKEADAAHEKTRVLRCLTSSADPTLVLEALNLTFSDEIREQEIVYLLRWVSSEGHETAWTWFKENWDLVLKKWGSGLLLSDMVKDIIDPLHSNEKADEIEEFFKNHPNSSIVMNVKQSIEQVRMKARWVQKIMQDQSLDELVKGLASRR